jgi:phage shock protein E
MPTFAPPTFVERYKKHLFIAGMVALSLLILILAYEYNTENPSKLKVLDAKARIMRGEIRTIVDVRSDIEWWAGHMPGAIHIPVEKLLLESAQALPNLNQHILIYCTTGRRAEHATTVLQSLGYKNVWFITDPYWKLM